MRLSYRQASQADLFKRLAEVRRSETRVGSHDSTGKGAVIWQYRDDGWRKQFEIKSATDVYAWWSAQDSTLDRTSVEDDWSKLLEAWCAWAYASNRHERAYSTTHKRYMYPREGAMLEYAVIAEGRYHYGSSIRARCSIEVWRKVRGEDFPCYEVLHLEHVGEAWSFVQEFLSYPPGLLLDLAGVDAFKEYKA